MRTQAIVEVEISAERGPCLANGIVGPKINLFILHGLPEPFTTNTLSRHAPLPSMLMAMPFLRTERQVKASLVN